MNIRKQRLLAGSVCSSLFYFSFVAAALSQQIDGADEAGTGDNAFSLRLGRGHSDNIYRAPIDELSGSYTALGLVIGHEHDSTRLQSLIDGDIEFRNYEGKTGLKDETVGFLNLQADVFLVPDRFSWTFVDGFRQGRVDAFGVDSPVNRDEINEFSTGPKLDLPLGGRSQLQLSTRKGRRTFDQASAIDTDTTLTEAALIRSRNTTTQYGLVATRSKSEYDDTSLDNSVDTFYLSYTKEFASGGANAAIGTTRVDFGNRDDSATYYDIGWERDVGTRSRLGLRVGNRYNDIGDVVRSQPNPLAADLGDALVLPDVFEHGALGVNWAITGPRTSVDITLTVAKDDYFASPEFDNDSDSVGVSVNRTISQKLDVGLSTAATRRDFVRIDQEDRDRLTRLWVRGGLASRLTFEASLERYSRRGDGTANYDETVARLFIGYSPGRNADQRP